MFNIRQVHLTVAGDFFGGVLFCAVLFPHEMSWMRSVTELNQFLRIFLHTLMSPPWIKKKECALHCVLLHFSMSNIKRYLLEIWNYATRITHHGKLKTMSLSFLSMIKRMLSIYVSSIRAGK